MFNQKPKRANFIRARGGSHPCSRIRRSTAPAVLILTRDKAIGALGETLWAAGVDYATVGAWADVRRTLERGRISMAVVDGDLPAAELEHVLAELPQVPLQAVLWLVSADPARAEHLQPAAD